LEVDEGWQETMIRSAPPLGSPAAVILAGGQGTRLQGVLRGLPKPLAPVGGQPFLFWILRYLAGQGIREAVVSAGYLPEQMQAFCRKQRVLPEVRCAVEPKPMGTAGGFLWASMVCPARPRAWLVLNGDSLACAPLAEFFVCLERADAVVLAVWQDDASRYGTLEIGEGSVLRSFKEKRPGSGWINAGVYLFRDSILPRFPSPRPLSFETEVFPSLLDQGVTVRVHQVRAPFLDIGTPESLSQAEAFVRGNQNWFSSPAESA